MCLLVLAWNSHPRYRLIFAGNRDEFHDRPASPMHWWPEQPDLLAGRDLKAGGTWLAVARTGRFGVVTNFRDLQGSLPGAPSRGGLITRYFAGDAGAEAFVQELRAEAGQYAGFSLLLADEHSLTYASNRAPELARVLPAGVFGLSNHLLDTPWPKLEITRTRFRRLLSQSRPEPDQLLDMLHDPEPTLDHPTGSGRQPRTGLSPDWERQLSAPFIINERYGTRCSTVVLIGLDGRVQVGERRFDADGRITGTDAFEFATGQGR